MGARVAAGLSGALLVMSITAGCTPAKPTTTKHYEPYSVETPTASPQAKVVKFTEESAARAGLQTVPVEQDGPNAVVPSSALIIDKAGAIIVFIAPAPLTYQRVAVDLVKDDGTKAWLSKGPAAGTLVVTVGSNQVWGAEQGVGH